MANQVEVIVGTYEEYLLGYKVGYSKNEKLSLSQSFATKSHSASVKCLAVSGKYLASGGSDDRIFIYDMLTRKEIQILIHHEGTVNAVEFTPDATHILSGGDDGNIIAIRVNTWQTQAEWKKAHGGAAVTNIKCHPTGKLAISLGNDIKLRSWNLIKGRLLYTTNLKSTLGRIADGVAWSKSGRCFTLTGDRIVQIWKIENASKSKEQLCDSRPTSVCWLTDEELVVGLENGKLALLTTDANKDPIYFDAHKHRIKAIAYVNNILATASSSGDIALWNLDLENHSLIQICLHNIGCRPTCIALIDLTQFDDDYVLKREEKETTNEIEKLSDKSNKSLKYTENVIVEYEDEDAPLLGTAKKKQHETKGDKTSKSVIKKNNKILGNQLKQNNEWIESPISSKPLAIEDQRAEWTETPTKDKLIKDNSKIKLKRKEISNDIIMSPKVKLRKESDSSDAIIKATSENFEQPNSKKQINKGLKGFENAPEKHNENNPSKVKMKNEIDQQEKMSKEKSEKFLRKKSLSGSSLGNTEEEEKQEKLEYSSKEMIVENKKEIQSIGEMSNKKKKEKQKSRIERQGEEKLENKINRDNNEEEIKQKNTPEKTTKITRSQAAKLLTADKEIMEKKTRKKGYKRII